MKAEFDNNGFLKVSAENNTEAFALAAWYDGYGERGDECTSVLSIDWTSYKCAANQGECEDQ